MEFALPQAGRAKEVEWVRGRGAIVSVLVALLGVVGKVSFLSGGWSGHSVLLDPRFGGSDGLGILVDGRMNHHLQQLSSRGVAHNPRIMAGRCLVLLMIFPCFSARFRTHTKPLSGAVLVGFSGKSEKLTGTNADAYDPTSTYMLQGDVRQWSPSGSQHGNPYGVLARTLGESDVGGVLARLSASQQLRSTKAAAKGPGLSQSENEDVYGALSALQGIQGDSNVGGSLTAKGMGEDQSWAMKPDSSAAGGALFSKSLGGDGSWMLHGSKDSTASTLRGRLSRTAHADHRRFLAGAAVSHNEVQGSLGSLPSVKGDAGGVLSHLKMSNPDGVLAVYGHTGEYVDKQRMKRDNKRLHVLKEFEAEAAEIHKAQVKRLKALESREAKEKREEAAREAAEPESTAVKRAHRRKEVSAVDAQQQKSKAAKQSASQQFHSDEMKLNVQRSAHVIHTVKHADVHANKDAPVMQHLSIKTHASQHKLAEAGVDDGKAEGKEGEGEGQEKVDRGIPAYKDIGWEKHQWDIGSWVLFAIMGPIVTLGIFGIVWHSAGWFAAMIMLFILLCMDISAYYYSWFLV